MIRGSCHCGKVRFEITGAPIRFAHCHCDDCRKIHGTTYASAIVLPRDAFKLTAGENEMTAYESSPGKFRYFCRHCGSPIHSTMKARPDVVIIRAGTLDDDPGVRPQMHIWVKAKAPWYEIHDDLPQYQEGYKP